MREEQDRLAREQVGRAIDGLNLVTSDELAAFKKSVGNVFNLPVGVRPLPAADVPDSWFRSAGPETVVNNTVTVTADSRFDGLTFRGPATAPLVVVDGAVAHFANCWFDRGPGSAFSWAQVTGTGGQAIFSDCWFVGDSVPAVIILNGGLITDVQVGLCRQRTTGPVAWGFVTTTGVL